MEDYLQNEIPKHKKKSKKSSKKSNHKHDYQQEKIEVMFTLTSGEWVHIHNRCTICGKERVDFKIIRKDS